MAKLTENDVKALARWAEENKQLQTEVAEQAQMLLNQANTIKQLQAEVDRLKSVLNEYADYHQIISDEIGATDEYRAKIHQQKANELRNKAQGASK